MSFLEKWSDNLSKYFEKGKPLHPFRALFRAADSFFLTPDATTRTGSHIRDSVDMKRIMITVMIALVPALLFGLWNIGYQHFRSLGETATLWQSFWYGFLKWMPLVIVVYISGLTVEIIFAQHRGHDVAEGFFVTGLILPMILPPDIPLWIVAVATIFATLFGKEVFGGTGYNFLNPALLARAFIFFAYPSTISGNSVWIAEAGDAVTGATPLGILSSQAAEPLPSMLDMFIGNIPGSIGETSKIAILIGAAILLVTQVASWRIMLSTIAGGYITAVLLNATGMVAGTPVPAYQHLLMGGFLFGAVFMATDPVTAAHTKIGKYIYGALVGIIAMLIRIAGKGYVEGIMLSILLMNIFAPLIDYCVVRANIQRRKNRARKI